MKKGLLSIIAMAVLMLASSVSFAQTTYTKVTSASGLEAGSQYIIVGYDEALGFCAMSYQKTANRHAIPVDENGGTISVTPATDPNSQTEVFQFTLEGSDGQWSFFDELKNGYLYAASSTANQLKTQTTLDNNGKWSIEFDADGNATVVAQGDNTRNIMRFNENSSNGTPLFSCYNSGSSINVPVSFYKAGGAATPDPEPSNYPTNFTASVDGLDITLTWTDAIGNQLPHKYLVLGSTGSITVPTDGTPVATGRLAANVNYGVQTVTFRGLDSGVTYHFAIFPYTNSGTNIDYKTDGNYPTANATTDEFFLFEDFNEELGQFTEYSVAGDQVWHQGVYQGTTYANMNGYANNVSNENEDWLISPELYLGSDIYYHWLKLEFRTAKKWDGNPIEVFISNDYDGQSDPNTAEWIDISDVFVYSTGDYEWVESGEYDILNLVEDGFYVAFRYTSTTAESASWEIDYVKITADWEVSVDENTLPKVSIYPSPAHDVVRFTLDQQAQVSVYDLSGRMVSDDSMNAGENSLNVAQLESGVYFLNVRYFDGKTTVTRFVKF